jgi:hypothetical protein
MTPSVEVSTVASADESLAAKQAMRSGRETMAAWHLSPNALANGFEIHGLFLDGNEHFRSGHYVIPLMPGVGPRGVPQGRYPREPRL